MFLWGIRTRSLEWSNDLAGSMRPVFLQSLSFLTCVLYPPEVGDPGLLTCDWFQGHSQL